MLVSIIVVFVIPAMWGEEAYGYVQLYYFYLTYISFFQLGCIDGIYLREGGQLYENLDQRLYATQLKILIIFEIFISICFAIFILPKTIDSNKQFVILTFCICIVIYIARLYLIYIFQATNRIREFAIVMLSEKIVFTSGLVLLCVTNTSNYKLIIYIDLIAKIVSLLIAGVFGRSIIFSEMVKLKLAINEIRNNIFVGYKIMLADFAGLLINGIVRFAIEDYWDIITFGKVSMSLSVSSMIMTFITAISVAIFPLLKRLDISVLRSAYLAIRKIIMSLLPLILVLYYPAKEALSCILPAYEDSFGYLVFMLPMCIYESKMSVLLTTYLKVLRKEKEILWINLISVLFSLTITFFTVYILHNLNGAMISLLIISVFRSFIAEVYLSRQLRINVIKDNIYELILIAYFICSFSLVSESLAIILYILGLLVYLIANKNALKKALYFFKKGAIKNV